MDCLTDIIEIDESLFGKKNKYCRGKLTKKVWVFGLAQRDSRHTRFFVIPNRKNETLHPLITNHVEKGICIFHDDWSGYRKLHDMGYPHGTVVHTREFKSADGVCTNLIEGIWGNLKMKINTQHGLRHYMLQDFLDEWSYRYLVNKDNTLWYEMLNLLDMHTYSPLQLSPPSETTTSAVATSSADVGEECTGCPSANV